MTPLEERLRTELRAESELITPGSLVDLKLPEPARPPRRVPRHWGPWHWPQWGKPLAAAAAVAAVIVGTIAGVDAIPRPAPLPTAAVTYTAAPAYYAYQASPGASVGVRSTATGKLLATVRPPRPDNDIRLLTSAANGTVFVYAAARMARPPTRGAWATDAKLPMEFGMFQVTEAGVVRLFPLSLPDQVTPAQVPNIALSPDGSKLALTYTGRASTAVVEVITLSTGSVLRWASPHSSWQPRLRDQGAWTADGRTFAVGQPNESAGGKPYRPGAANAVAVHLFSVTAHGTRLVLAKSLTLRSLAGQSLTPRPFLTPDGNTLIVPTLPDPSDHPGGQWKGELAVYSTRTGTLLDTVAQWVWTWRPRTYAADAPRPIVAWSSRSGDQLILLMPVDRQNYLGVFNGRLTPPGSAASTSFTPGGAGLPPFLSAAFRTLENALRVSPQLVW